VRPRHVLLALAAVSAPPPAPASGGTPAAEGVTSASNVVDIQVAAVDAAAAAAVRDDLHELLGRIGVTTRYREITTIDSRQVLRPDPVAPPALARVWLDLAASDANRAVLYLADARWQRILVRYVALVRGLDEVARQEVAHIVASSVEALQSGAELGVVREGDVLLAAEGPAAPPPSPRSEAWMTAGVSGAAERWSGGHVAVPALGVSLVLGQGRWWSQPALWVNAAYHAATVAGDPVSLRLRGADLAVLALVRLGGGPRTRLRIGAGPGGDLLSAEPSLVGQPDGVELDPPRWVPTFFMRTAARLDHRLSPAVLIFVAAACDVQIASSRYVVERPSSVEPVFQPARLRPSVMLGVEALILGGGP
jgi:hypothetical protein